MFSRASAPRGDVADEQGHASCHMLLPAADPRFHGPSAAQKSKDDSQETKLLIMEHLWNEAQVNRDARVLDAMLGGQFVNTEYDGEVSDKAKFLADIKDPQFKPTILTIQDVKVSMYADSAVVVGIYHAKGIYQNKPYEHLGRFTDTWLYAEGRW